MNIPLDIVFLILKYTNEIRTCCKFYEDNIPYTHEVYNYQLLYSEITESLEHYVNLQSLTTYGCKKLKKIPKSLKTLVIDNTFCNIDASSLKNLNTLSLNSVYDEINIKDMDKLQYLDLDDCTNVNEIDLKNLKVLSICKSGPVNKMNVNLLDEVIIESDLFKNKIPECKSLIIRRSSLTRLDALMNLTKLYLYDCPNLEQIEYKFFEFDHSVIEEMEIISCPKIENIPFLNKLKRCKIYNDLDALF